MGFCMGGQLALQAAVEHGDTVTCGVDFYGIHPSVELDFSKLSVPVLAHFGKGDEFVDEPSAKALVASIREAGGSIDPHFYETGHAFFNDARPDAYDEASAKTAMSRTLEFLRTQLG